MLLAASVALAAVALLAPDPLERLLHTPLTLPAGIAAVVVTAAAIAAWGGRALPTAALERAAAPVLGLVALALAGFSLMSVGRFMTLDLPDEPWVAATAVNYATSGSLAIPERAWVYTIPTPAIQHYYILMGLWLRALNNTALLALRGFPLLVGVLAALVTAGLLCRTPDLRPAARWGGLCALLAFSPFVRTSHNLRADVGLAVYGALLLGALTRPLNRRIAFGAGVALWIGLESLPTTALTVGGAAGLVLLLINWRQAATYALGGLTALGLYALRFLPDPVGNLRLYAALVRYYDQNGLIGLRWSLATLMDYHLRFALLLSPAEIGLFGLALVGLWQGARRSALTLLMGGTLMLTGFAVSYGYWAVFAPFVAYGVALALRRQGRLAAGLVLILATALAPLRDMAAAFSANANAETLAQTDLLTGQFPPGSIVVGDDVFWFTLHEQRTFVGWVGLERFAVITGLRLEEALTVLEADAAICDDRQTARCARLRRSGLFAPPLRFRAGGQSYWIFQRRGVG